MKVEIKAIEYLADLLNKEFESGKGEFDKRKILNLDQLNEILDSVSPNEKLIKNGLLDESSDCPIINQLFGNLDVSSKILILTMGGLIKGHVYEIQLKYFEDFEYWCDDNLNHNDFLEEFDHLFYIKSSKKIVFLHHEGEIFRNY